MPANLTYTIDPELKPHIKELDFDIESYDYGLRVMGVSEEWVDGHSVRFAYSEEPYTKGVTQWLTNMYTLGHYYPFKKEVTLFPRTIAFQIKHDKSEILPEEYGRQSGNRLSSVTNYVLMHETGHLADFSHTDLLQDVAVTDEKRAAVGKFKNKTGIAALAGAVVGSELAEFTTLQPAVGSLIGLVIAGGVTGVVTLREASGQIADYSEKRRKEEAAAEAFVHDAAVQALMGNLVQIELTK